MIEYIFDIRLVISVIVIVLLYIYGTFKQDLHVRLGCNGPKPLPFFGNTISFFTIGIHEFDKMCRKKFGLIYPIYFGGRGVTIVADEEVLKQILIKEFKCFTDRMDLGIRTKSTKKMLSNMEGKDWERVRNIVTPTFTSGKLKKMSPLLNDCLELLSKRLKSLPDNETIDIKEFFGALTMDAIARTMFGMEIDSQTNPNNLFISHAKNLFTVTFRTPTRMLILLFPVITSLILKINPNWEFLGSDTMDFFNSNIQKAIQERKMSKEPYNDFLALMLKAYKEDKEDDAKNSQVSESKLLTFEEIVAQCLIFLIAGYETTATALTFASYHLARNRDVQQQLYEELLEALDNNKGEISYDMLMKMPLLDAAINETLRICPPAVRFDRTCTKDVDLVTSDNRIIHAKVGDIFAVPVYAIHTDPSIWPDPDVFDISRFTQDSKKNRGGYAFMPFGMGPRNCVGMRFALLEIKWALATILKDFEIVPCEKTIETIKFKKFGLTQSDTPIVLKLNKRE